MSKDKKGSKKFKKAFQKTTEKVKGKKESSNFKSKLTCFKCDKPGHFQNECPELKEKKDKKKGKKYEKKRYNERKAMIAQLAGSDTDDTSSSEE